MLNIKSIRPLPLLIAALFLIGAVPVRAQTVQPTPSTSVISPDNIAQLQQTRLIGRGDTQGLGTFPTPDWFPDGKHVLTITDAGLWVFDVTTPADQGTFYVNANYWPIAISPDSQYLALTTNVSVDLQTTALHISVIDMGSGKAIMDRVYVGKVFALAFTADNRHLVLSGDARKNTTELWNFVPGDSTAESSIPFASTQLQYLPRLGLMALLNSGEIQLWDMTALKLKKRIATSVFYATLTADASALISYNGSDVVITSLVSKRQVQIGKDNINQYALSPDGAVVAMPAPVDDSQILLWSVKTNTAIRYLKGHTNHISDLAYSPDGHLIASSSAHDGTTRLWDTDAGRELRQLSVDGLYVIGMAFSPDSTQLAAFTATGKLVIQDVATNATVALWGGFYSTFTSMAYNGTLLAVTTNAFGTYPSLVLLRADHKDAINMPDQRQNPFRLVRFSADGNRLIATSNGLVRLLDGQTGKLLNVWGFQSENGIALNNDGSVLALGTYDKTVPYNYDAPAVAVNLWDIATGRLLHRLPGGVSGIADLTFSPDGKTLAVAYCTSTDCGWFNGDKTNNQDKLAQQITVRLWDIQSEKVLYTLQGFKGRIASIAFSHDGKTLVSGDHQGNIISWDVQTGQQTQVISTKLPIHKIVLSSDDRLIASSSLPENSPFETSDPEIQLWDSLSGKLLSELYGSREGATDLVFSPDGRQLLAATTRGTIRIWTVSGP